MNRPHSSHDLPARSGPLNPKANPDASSAHRSLAAYPPALVETTLARVVASHTFRRSQRHRQFLDYVVRAAIAGHHARLKEVVIGLEVFGRDLGRYDTRYDPVVRVEAGRVRGKLARYYAGEGAADPFEIVIPLGSYLPHLARRKAAAPSARPVGGSLAVLPFANLSGHDEDFAFSAGLAGQLIDALGRVPDLKVVARTSSFKAQEKGLNLKGIGKLLSVEHVVEGSIQRSGSRVRCIANLSRAKDGVHLWSEQLEHDGGDRDDLFAFQDRIADSVLAAVAALVEQTANRGALAPSVTARPTSTENKQARDLFERGRYMAQQRTFDGYAKAIDLFERAVSLDPNFAQAYSHLGASQGNLSALLFEPTAPAWANVERSASRALELDPLDGEAHAVLGAVAYRIEFNWPKAEALFRDALRLAPNSTVTHTSCAWGLVFNGRYVEAIQHARIALELDPLNLGLRANNALIYAYARAFDTAIAEFRAVLDLEPGHLFSHVMLGVTHLWKGECELAMRHFERVVDAMPEHPSAHFCKVCVYGMRGDVERAEHDLATLLERLGDSHYSHYNCAMARFCLGDHDGAYASLERAAQARDVLFASLPVDPLFDGVREDPAFIALLRRHGLDTLPPSPVHRIAQRPLGRT